MLMGGQAAAQMKFTLHSRMQWVSGRAVLCGALVCARALGWPMTAAARPRYVERCTQLCPSRLS